MAWFLLTPHHAYIEAVAKAVRSTGIPVGDVDEPRGGSFRIGGDLEDFWDDDTGYGPSLVHHVAGRPRLV